MKFNKTNITKLLIEIQDADGIQLACNQIVTRAIKQLGLESLHQKLTENPKSCYPKKKKVIDNCVKKLPAGIVIPNGWFRLEEKTPIKRGDKFLFKNKDDYFWRDSNYCDCAEVGDEPCKEIYIRTLEN